MDHKKIREFVRQAHPNGKIMESDPNDPANSADGSEADVDSGNLRLSNWEKFGSARAATRDEGEDSMSNERSNPRDKFRQRILTGGSNAASDDTGRRNSGYGRFSAVRGEAGKIALERLEVSRNGADTVTSDDSVDLLIDEDVGIIGESDSGPEKK